jgi:voltage-gated potassium channel
MYAKLKRRTLAGLEEAQSGDLVSRGVDLFLISLIALNVLAVILETVDFLATRWMTFFDLFEKVSVALFTVEYLLRMWACTANERYAHPVFGRIRFALTFFAVIDLLAILPFYLPMIVALDLRFLRAVRLFRIFRLFKAGRYSESLRTMGRIFARTRAELSITLFLTLILLVLASALMYFAEQDVQPEAFSSIPAAMWWGVVTLTTVGYGDIFPVTTLGRLIGTLIAILGMGEWHCRGFSTWYGVYGARWAYGRSLNAPREAPRTSAEAPRATAVPFILTPFLFSLPFLCAARLNLRTTC